MLNITTFGNSACWVVSIKDSDDGLDSKGIVIPCYSRMEAETLAGRLQKSINTYAFKLANLEMLEGMGKEA